MSNYTKATNFTAKDTLPTGNSNKIVKGTEIDTELTAVAAAIISKADINSPTFTGTPTCATSIPAGTSNTQLATTAFVTTALAGAFSAGMILLWSGSVASIPSGWYLCNGSNGTPDLRNKFIVGAGDSYDPADEGGSADAIVVAHTHTATSTTTATDDGHVHSVWRSGGSGNGGGPGAYGSNDAPTYDSGTGYADITATTTTTIASTGDSGTDANLPPYYALAYIMKG